MRVHRSLLAIALLVAGVLGASFLTPRPAEAGGGVHIGFGTSYGFGHHRHYGHRHFYGYRHYPFHRRYGYPFYRHRHYGYPRPYYPRRYAEPAPKPAPRQTPKAEEPTVAYDTTYCREYSRSTVIDGRKVEVFGRACRQEDGTWRIIN